MFYEAVFKYDMRKGFKLKLPFDDHYEAHKYSKPLIIVAKDHIFKAL